MLKTCGPDLLTGRGCFAQVGCRILEHGWMKNWGTFHSYWEEVDNKLAASRVAWLCEFLVQS